VDWAVKGKLNDVFTREVGCPECLLTKDPRDAAMWKEASVLIAGNECILCSNQAQVHRVDPRILRGEYIHNHLDDESCSIKSGFSQFSLISHYSAVSQSIYDGSEVKPSRNVVDIRPSVVLVGIWDTKQGLITSLGSGFIADTQRGLIITAGHTFYHFEADKSIGPKYHGIDGARAIIGVYDSSTESALFQYTADIVTEDLENVDACVLRLKSKFESPLKADGNRISYPQAEVGIFNPKADGLRRLGMTDKVELESSVRMIGYDQEGDEIYHEGVDYSPCYRFGRVIKKSDRRSTSSQSSHSSAFISNNNMTDNVDSIRYHCPSLWIKAHLRTRHGHSGGPVVNDAGLVIGIVSSADHEEEELCYLAPSKLLYSLLKKARKKISDLSSAHSQW
jgi:S1-C subfamily serine protease